MYAVVMILRVWALYGRQRFILFSLLVLYGTEVISYLVSSVLTSARGVTIGM